MDQGVKKDSVGHSYLEFLMHLQSSVKLGCSYLKEVEDVMKLTCIASSLVLVVGWGLWFLFMKTFPHDMVAHWKVSVLIVCPFFDWDIFLILNCVNCLCISESNPLSATLFANIFPYSAGCLFSIVYGVLCCTKSFKLN